MTPASDSPAGPALGALGIAPVAMPTRPVYWSIRRELWESRSISIAPLVVAAVVFAGSLISVSLTANKLRAVPAIGQAAPDAAMVQPFKMAPAPIMLATFLVGIFYSLDALYGERRDRSILFWKSFPVSDLTTVLSKAAIPLAVLPSIAYVLSVVTQLALLVTGTMILRGSGVSAASVWAEVRFFEGLLVMLYGLTVHVLWFAPIYGWLLLVSAWARRMPVLWAVLPPLAISALESIAFGSSAFASLLKYRVTGAMAEAFTAEVRDGDVDRIGQLDPARYLAAPGLWLGLGATAAFLVMAARLRRNRDPI